tara:strand:+ start:1224 stop:1598 length:375 start_codon:yes stop_codon:yes gene_type:complete
MKINILDAIHSLKPEYINKPIIVYTEDHDIGSAGTKVDWGGATPISNTAIATEQARQQKIEDECYQPRRIGIGITGGYSEGYPSIVHQLDLLYHDMKNGKLGTAATTGDWYVGITSIKSKFPKP